MSSKEGGSYGNVWRGFSASGYRKTYGGLWDTSFSGCVFKWAKNENIQPVGRPPVVSVELFQQELDNYTQETGSMPSTKEMRKGFLQAAQKTFLARGGNSLDFLRKQSRKPIHRTTLYKYKKDAKLTKSLSSLSFQETWAWNVSTKSCQSIFSFRWTCPPLRAQSTMVNSF